MNNKIKALCCLCVVIFVRPSVEPMENIPNDYAERMQAIEIESYGAIDAMFIRLRTAIVSKEKMSDYEWFKYLNDNKIQYLLSDARILCFDSNTTNVMAEKVDAYLQKKIRDEMHLVIAQRADIKGVRQFLATSKMICDLSEGINCNKLIRTVKRENKQIIDVLKAQREAHQKEACLARESMLNQPVK